MEDRDTELKYIMPTHEEIDARVRQAYELRSEMLAQGLKWVLRQVWSGLHWLVGLEWGDADRSRRDELKLRYLRAAAPAHLAPAPGSLVRLEPAATRRARRAQAEEGRARAA